MKANILLLTTFLFVVILQAQEKTKDTLFFKLDDSYIYESKYDSNKFYLKDKNTDEELYFKGFGICNNLKPKKILSLQDFIRNSKFYDKTKKNKLNNSELADFLSTSKIYLVRKKDEKTEYIDVHPTLSIND